MDGVVVVDFSLERKTTTAAMSHVGQTAQSEPHTTTVPLHGLLGTYLQSHSLFLQTYKAGQCSSFNNATFENM